MHMISFIFWATELDSRYSSSSYLSNSNVKWGWWRFSFALSPLWLLCILTLPKVVHCFQLLGLCLHQNAKSKYMYLSRYVLAFENPCAHTGKNYQRLAFSVLFFAWFFSHKLMLSRSFPGFGKRMKNFPSGIRSGYRESALHLPQQQRSVALAFFQQQRKQLPSYSLVY